MRAVWDDRSDEELLGRSRQEPGAFGVFYGRHEERLLGYFLRRVGDAEVWSPEPWHGAPIRFFYVLVDAPHGKARAFLLRDSLQLVARDAGGERLEVVP